MSTKYVCEPNAHKQKTVAEFVKLFEQYPIVGTINIRDLPASPLQVIRGKLREKCVVRMTKRRLLTLAIEKAKGKRPGLEKLIPHLDDMPAILFTKDNPFAVFNSIKQNKSPASAKAGQKAPRDIIVPAGPTAFAPGPVIGELAQLGIKAKVEGGKIAIVADTKVAKEGDTISQKLAEMLVRLGIQPMEVGLDLRFIFENGEVLPRSVLDIDQDKYESDIAQAAQWAFNLAVEAAIPLPETTELLIQKAFREAKAVAKEANIPTKETIGEMLALAEAQAAEIGSHVKSG